MKVELKEITEQLTSALPLDENYRVAALFEDEDDKIIGWQIVKYDPETGNIEPTGYSYNNIKELFEAFYSLV